MIKKLLPILFVLILLLSPPVFSFVDHPERYICKWGSNSQFTMEFRKRVIDVVDGSQSIDYEMWDPGHDYIKILKETEEYVLLINTVVLNENYFRHYTIGKKNGYFTWGDTDVYKDPYTYKGKCRSVNRLPSE
jgi:hypothetical protein